MPSMRAVPAFAMKRTAAFVRDTPVNANTVGSTSNPVTGSVLTCWLDVNASRSSK
jgi:hypothetical protein